MRTRIQLLFVGFLVGIGAIIIRLAYWQIIQGQSLKLQAQAQYTATDVTTPERGNIYTSDGYPLVINRPVYTLGAYSPAVKLPPQTIVSEIMPLLKFTVDDPAVATDPAKSKAALADIENNTKNTMLDRLGHTGYSVLERDLSQEEKEGISALGISGLTFDQSFTRDYPEASMSAAVTGFVGRDNVGESTGYFGLEGFYDRELAGRVGISTVERDAAGNPLLIGDYQTLLGRNGRSLRLYMNRGIEYIVNEELKSAVERYGAAGGDVVVMDPQTGGILAMAGYPSYDPAKFNNYDPGLYKNPVVADAYEPGSTFKVLVMAAALNENAVTETDKCDICTGPVTIGPYTIRTWDNKYHPLSTPEDILVHFDNVGMVWVERKLGRDKMLQYINNYGFGEKTGIDLQEEVSSNLRDKWGDIDYATSSFGQGIAVTSIQMVRAVAAIANGGLLMEPHVVQAVVGDSGVQAIAPKVVRRVFSADTASRMTSLMVAAVDKGEAKWTDIPGYNIAGKTGTAQIPVAGHYDATKTIASFVGFAPAENPRFVMLVKLREPTSSPWGSETAAPLWFAIARKLLLEYNIPPTN